MVVWAGLGMKMEMHLATEGTGVLGVGWSLALPLMCTPQKGLCLCPSQTPKGC